jgi:hypothetical protein
MMCTSRPPRIIRRRFLAHVGKKRGQILRADHAPVAVEVVDQHLVLCPLLDVDLLQQERGRAEAQPAIPSLRHVVAKPSSAKNASAASNPYLTREGEERGGRERHGGCAPQSWLFCHSRRAACRI